MSYELVIAEKPSVARSIAGVIGADKKQDGYMEGNGYLVSWCIGHLVSLADAGTYDERFKKWRYDDLPILPQEWQYIIPDDKKKQFDTLRSLMERPDVTGLVCAQLLLRFHPAHYRTGLHLYEDECRGDHYRPYPERRRRPESCRQHRQHRGGKERGLCGAEYG